MLRAVAQRAGIRRLVTDGLQDGFELGELDAPPWW
jgi:hypothetical protein